MFLTCTESETPTSEYAKVVGSEVIKPHELRALNFLVNEYLLRHNYKLTSITFADENEGQVLSTFFISYFVHKHRVETSVIK